MKDTGSQRAAEVKELKGRIMKCTRDAQSDVSGSSNAAQKTAAWLVDATKAAERLDTPQNRSWPKGD